MIWVKKSAESPLSEPQSRARKGKDYFPANRDSTTFGGDAPHLMGPSRRNGMRKCGSPNSKSPAQLIDAKIAELGDWRGKGPSLCRRQQCSGRFGMVLWCRWKYRHRHWTCGRCRVGSLGDVAAPGMSSLDRTGDFRARGFGSRRPRRDASSSSPRCVFDVHARRTRRGARGSGEKLRDR